MTIPRRERDELDCVGCRLVKPRSAYYRSNYSRCIECLKIPVEPRPPRPVANLRSRRRSQGAWRLKPHHELLAAREALRRGEGLFRCLLPRVPETAEAVLATRLPCAGMCLAHRRAEHLVGVHELLGGLLATEEQLAEFFAVTATVEDRLDADTLEIGDPR